MGLCVRAVRGIMESGFADGKDEKMAHAVKMIGTTDWARLAPYDLLLASLGADIAARLVEAQA